MLPVCIGVVVVSIREFFGVSNYFGQTEGAIDKAKRNCIILVVHEDFAKNVIQSVVYARLEVFEPI